MNNIYNLYENVTYRFDEGKQSFTLSWDKSNNELNELMDNELSMVYGGENIFTNSSFVNVIKEQLNWIEGQTIHFNICNGLRVTIKILDNAYQDEYTFLELNGDGYLYIKEFRGNCHVCKDATEFITYKKNCYYNDLITENENPYILK
jgi:hypothetical protein